MSTEIQPRKKLFPDRLLNNYKQIQKLLNDCHKNDVITEENIRAFEGLLNDSLPNNEYEFNQKQQEYLHFTKDPEGYVKHINTARLRFLILWTNYKYISTYFKLRNMIHLRWNKESQLYECQLYDESKRTNSKN